MGSIPRKSNISIYHYYHYYIFYHYFHYELFFFFFHVICSFLFNLLETGNMCLTSFSYTLPATFHLPSTTASPHRTTPPPSHSSLHFHYCRRRKLIFPTSVPFPSQSLLKPLFVTRFLLLPLCAKPRHFYVSISSPH